MSFWNPEREGLLKQLWAQGLSAKQIAARLGGGISRNAVIGKRIRLGLPDRVTPTAGTGGRNGPRATKTVRIKKPKSVPAIEFAPVKKPRAPERGAHSIRHSERNWFQCPMFCAGEEGASGFICGKPMEFPAQKWCRDCAKFVYTPAPPVRVRRVA